MLCGEDDLIEFVAKATAGEQRSYARGERAPAPLRAMVTKLADAELLIPVSKREGREFLFLVQRTSRPFTGDATGRLSRGRVRRKAIRRSSLSMVLACLTSAAAAGRPSPTNEQIARACRLTGKDAARYRVGLLVRQGRIAIEDCGPLAPRVVTILTGRHAGKSTLRLSQENQSKGEKK